MSLDLGIVIVTWNVRELLAACLDSVYVDLAASGLRARVCVVDNGSGDGTAEFLRAQFPNTQLIEAENYGMGAGNNLGLKALGFDHKPQTMDGGDSSVVSRPPTFALILNPDTIIRPGALRTLVDFLRANPKAAVAAPKLMNTDGTLQHSGFRFPGVVQAVLDLFPPPPRLWRLIDSPLNGRYPAGTYAAASPFRVDFALGAALAVRAEAIPTGELFDESFFMYCEEIDAQWRLRARGWETWLVPGAEIVHLGGRSSSQVASRSFVNLWTSRRKLYRRYHGPLVNALVAALVQAGMRQRIRANHRASQTGHLNPDRRAELNAMLNEVIAVWSRKSNVKRDA